MGEWLDDLGCRGEARALAAAIAALRSAELIDDEGSGELAFKHPLTQEVAYETQLLDRRRRVHAVVARCLEVLHAERLGEQAALIAHHWSAAERRSEAAAWRYRAALKVSKIQVARVYTRKT